MANLKEIAEAAWRQAGGAKSESRITLEEVIATAKSEYAYQSLLWAWKVKQEEGEYEIDGRLVLQSDPLPVKNNEIDISNLKILTILPCEVWLRNIGGLTCDCTYIKSTINNSQKLCDDDSLPDDVRTYMVVGKKIIFPRGTHADKLPIIYATNGESLEDEDIIEVEDGIAGLVRNKLNDIYIGKTVPSDQTINQNPNS